MAEGPLWRVVADRADRAGKISRRSGTVEKVFTRRGNDWTKRFRKIAADAYLINAGSAIIDGEVVVPAADGTTDFSVLQNELTGNSTKIVMVAFDLLYLNGHDLRRLPLLERKAILRKLIAKTAIQFSESFELDGREMFKHACKALFPRCGTAVTRPTIATIGLR
jgi:bifunctional non-homologous end joining protein LigD